MTIRWRRSDIVGIFSYINPSQILRVRRGTRRIQVFIVSYNIKETARSGIGYINRLQIQGVEVGYR